MAGKRRYTQLSNEELKTILEAHFQGEHWQTGYRLARLDTTHQGGVSIHWIHGDYYVETKD
jgi:hypothetical protein